MNKINEHKLRQYGKRAFQLTVPNVYSKDNNLKSGDQVSIFRTEINGVDAFVVVPSIKSDLIKNNSIPTIHIGS